VELYVHNNYTIKTLEMAYTQSKHKRMSHFKNDTENKCSILRTLHLHHSIENLFQMTQVIVFVAHLLDATSFENGYPTTESLCVMLFAKKQSVIAVQRAFRTQCHMEPPS
jgi:hypothetical protein